jgi:hypothetical protein
MTPLIKLFADEKEEMFDKISFNPIVIHKKPCPVDVLQVILKQEEYLDYKGVCDDLHLLTTTINSQQQMLMEQALQHGDERRELLKQIELLTNRLTVVDENKDDDDNDDDNSISNVDHDINKKRKRRYVQHCRLLTENPTCSKASCKNKVMDRFKYTGAYKKQCITCIKSVKKSKSKFNKT